MQGKYILCALIVVFLVCAPTAASTKKIATGATVFIGESDLDISSAIRDCKVIAWWPDETNMSGPAAKNITIQRVNDVILPVNHFNISPNLFGGYPGNWYCEDKKPSFIVLNVDEPEISIRVWDVDKDEDITGQAVPVTTNITYRIDTNLYQALGYANRTNLNPADGFFTVTLTSPSGKEMKNIYTGSVGSSTTQILIFDNNPFINTPTFYGKNLNVWNRLSRDATGGYLYPLGTYTFTVVQNLNNMQAAYTSSGNGNNNEKTSSSASVAFIQASIVTPSETTAPQQNVTGTPEQVTTVKTMETTLLPTPAPTEAPVVTKTTYSPLPVWIMICSLIAALVIAQRLRK